METEAPVNNRSREDSTILAYVLKDNEGHVYPAECVDITDNGLIFQVDPEYVKDGTFADVTLDSRYFEEMGLVVFIVMHPSDLIQ